ncbi:glycosyltransferase family A protein [Flavobacterium sp. FlaQc-52]|uniref:glycosyltransferase family A protein n=1 Tax=Flavobacterium sp. FlaQc-52 TaxID=3374185 RepID=UPI003757CED5
MFPHKHFSNFNLLIVNQSESSFLSSEFDSVKVINCREKGLSKSRNKAIDNACKKICLIADDDVIFEENLRESITLVFEEQQNADIITFNHTRSGNFKPIKNRDNIFEHDRKSIWNVSSIEIAFRLEEIKKKELRFEENFGLGALFETAEEFLFLRAALDQKLKVWSNPKVIVSHPEMSSGKMEGTDILIFSRAALFYKLYGVLAYGWLLKYVFFLIRKKNIRFSQAVKKYREGSKGIEKYKRLTHDKL